MWFELLNAGFEMCFAHSTFMLPILSESTLIWEVAPPISLYGENLIVFCNRNNLQNNVPHTNCTVGQLPDRCRLFTEIKKNF